MDTPYHSLRELFAQLGLPNTPNEIRDFIRQHRPLDGALRLKDAPFWNVAQSALIEQKLSADDDWALVVDGLNVLLRAHTDPP